jgi:hypothetical protein
MANEIKIKTSTLMLLMLLSAFTGWVVIVAAQSMYAGYKKVQARQERIDAERARTRMSAE